MLVTASLAGREVCLELDEDCRSLSALRRLVRNALPHLEATGFTIVADGCTASDDEAVWALEDGSFLQIVASRRVLARAALREAGKAVSGAGLCAAAEAGDLDLCAVYLDAGVSAGCADAAQGGTPLHAAALEGCRSVCELLLDHGHAADVADGLGWTPLHYAALGGHSDVCALLLDRRHTADAAATDGCTALHCAAMEGHVPVCEVLLRHTGSGAGNADLSGATPLHYAAQEGWRAVCALLLRSGHKVDAADAEGWPPLHRSSQQGHRGVCELLLEWQSKTKKVSTGVASS